MRSLFKKIIAFLIVAVMLFISCAPTLSYAAEMYVKIRRFDGSEYSYDSKTVWDYALDNSSIGDFYCLREGADLGDWQNNDTKLESNMNVLDFTDISNVDITNFEQTTGATFRSNVQYLSTSHKYSGSKQKSVKALEWLGKNMYLVSSDTSSTEKTLMIENINKYIQKYCDSSVKNCNLGLLSEEQIGVIQQFVVWNFVELHENRDVYLEVQSINDIKKITGINTDEKAKAGFALYSALTIGAIEYANGNNDTINMNSSNKFNVNVEDKKINPVQGEQNTYIVGPITVTGQNLEKFTISIAKSNKNVQLTEWSIISKNNSTILQGSNVTSSTDVKNKLVGQTFYIKFKTAQELTENPGLQFIYTYKYNPTLTSYNAKVYYKQNKQPIVGINKEINQEFGNYNIQFNYDVPEFEFDLALTKEIAQVYRYNGKAFETVYNNNRLNSIGSSNGTTTKRYYMNKEPVNVNPGDIIRYKITVYNEGNKDGWVKQIKDYLPEGLEPVNVTINSGTYQNQKNSNITYSETEKVVRYSIPEDKQIIKEGESFNISLDCRVSYTNTQNSILKNVAAITYYGYKNANGLDVACTVPGVDIDSYQSNLTNNYTEYVQSIDEKSEGKYLKNIDKGSLVKEDDEDFEQVKVGYFDLALRKFITSVNSMDFNNRVPEITNTTIIDYNNGATTAKYTHTKAPITVKEGDTVRYIIRVYNEGYIDGVAKEIRDYLPEGLKLKENSSINAQYGWQKATNGQNYIYTNLLRNVSITPSNGKEGFVKLLSNTLENEFWHDLEVECVVQNVSDKEGQILTNMAEITSYGYNEYEIDSNGKITSSYKDCSQKGIDIDSELNTLLNDLSSKQVDANVNGYYNYQTRTHTIEADLEYQGLQDDDDFENLKVKSNSFDLALRKFISKVNGQEPVTKREPYFFNSSLEKLSSSTTAEYYHTKYPVTVNRNDTIIYTIRVYNEGEKNGLIKEITDYLPSGIEFIPTTESEINRTNGWIATVNADGSTTVKTNKNFTVKASNGVEGYRKLLNNTLQENEKFWYDLELECKVVSGIDGEILADIAEITNYGYMQGNDYIQANTKGEVDIDSKNNNVLSLINTHSEAVIPQEQVGKYIDSYYKNQNVTGGKTLYEGLEDDDDFEDIKVNSKYDMKLNLIKEDEDGNRISGAKFKAWKTEVSNELLQSITTDTISADVVNAIKSSNNTSTLFNETTINGSKNTDIQGLVANKNYFYILQETESDDTHDNLFEGYTILIPATLDVEGKVYLQTTNETTNTTYNRGVIILKQNANGTYTVQPYTSNLYNEISVVADNSSVAQINVTVKNPEIDISGKYRIRLNKVDSSNNNSGIPNAVFDMQINKKVDGSTESNIIAKRFETSSQEGTVGTRTSQPITIDGVGTDEVTITEVEIKNNNSYIKLTEIPKLYITKEQTSADTYQVTKVAFEGKTAGTSSSIEHQGVTLQANIVTIGQLTSVEVTIPNKKFEGSYNLQIKKTDDAEEPAPISGVTFEVKDSEGNIINHENYSTNSNGLTEIIARNINGEGMDRYDIKELSVGNNPYIKLKNDQPISIFVTTAIENDQYKATNVSFSDVNPDDKTINVELENDQTVEAKVELVGNTVTLTIQNQKIEGKYVLKVEKVDNTNRNIKLQGVKFEISKNNVPQNTYPTTGTNSNGRIILGKSYSSSIEINSKNVNTDDIYTITEASLGDNKYIRLAEPITLKVHKETDGSVYKAVSAVFDNNDTKKNVKLIDNTEVEVEVTLKSRTITVTVPNKPIEGKYGIVLLKTKEDGKTALSDVTFKVTKDDEPFLDKEVTDQNGKITILDVEEITSKTLGTEIYKISEVSSADGYMKISGEIPVYVTKAINENGTAYEAKASFARDEVQTETVAVLANQSTVPVKLDVAKDQNNADIITISVKNTELKGKYGLEIIKTDENDNPIENVEFKVTESDGTSENYKTNKDGKATVFTNKDITLKDVKSKDVYTIEEVKTGDGFIALPENEKINIYVSKDENSDKTALVATTASFESEKQVNTKNITLPNGKEVTLSLNVANGIVTLTIPNRKIEGKYDLELIKLDQIDGESPLPGVTFDVITKKGNEEIKLYDINGKEIDTKGLTTNSEGKIVIQNVKITEGANYNFEITETKVPDGYVMLKDKIKLSFTTNVDETSKYVLSNVKLTGVAKYSANSNKITVTVQNGQFDLALRKYITSVTAGKGTENERIAMLTNRVPVFKIDENGKYIYEHDKNAVLVGNQNVVEYTLRVYNEGSISGYASEVKDDIPEGLEFLPDDKINKKYGWKLLDEKGNEVKEVNKAKYIVTDYLSKENEATEGENLIRAFNTKDYKDGKIKEPYYKEVKVAFKVTMPNTDDRIIINKAQISEDSDENGDDVTDIDSTPDKWIDGEDDQDIEKIKVQYFDLALRKWVTKAFIIEDGKETVVETGHTAEDDPEEIVKVDLKDSKINNVVVKFEYRIRIKNEGQIAGYAKEISDYIPEGLRFNAADNSNWKEVDGKIVTTELENTLLQPGETAEVSVILTWINKKDNLGLKVNVAEISKDYNPYYSPDIDSTPNNKVPGEDDIDDAPVMLTVKTGQAATYVGLVFAVLTILGSGVVVIKKYVLK